jgi:hypothetical protein
MPDKLRVTDEMLKSEYLPHEAGDLVATTYRIETSEESAAKLRQLPVQWGTLEALMYYDMEVNNGGHHQYFWNARGYFVDLVEKGLEHFGAREHLQIFREARSRYDPKRYLAEDAERDPKKAFLRGYDEKRYEDLDNRYYDANPQLAKIVDEYIRAHVVEFR